MNPQHLEELQRRIAEAGKSEPQLHHYKLTRGQPSSYAEECWNIRVSVQATPPQLRTIMLTDFKQHFRLMFPPTIFGVVHAKTTRGTRAGTSLFVFWCQKLDGSLQLSEVSIPLLPNVYRTGRVCLGCESIPYDTPDEEVIRRFWQVPFCTEGRSGWTGFEEMVRYGSEVIPFSRSQGYANNYDRRIQSARHSYELWQEDPNNFLQNIQPVNPYSKTFCYNIDAQYGELPDVRFDWEEDGVVVVKEKDAAWKAAESEYLQSCGY